MVITLIEARNGFLMALSDMIFQSRVHDRMIVLISNLVRKKNVISSSTSLYFTSLLASDAARDGGTPSNSTPPTQP